MRQSGMAWGVAALLSVCGVAAAADRVVDGFDLGKLMSAAKQKGAKIPPLVAAFIVSEAAKGLHYAHERKDEGGSAVVDDDRVFGPREFAQQRHADRELGDAFGERARAVDRVDDPDTPPL